MLPRTDLNTARSAAAIEAPAPVSSATDPRQEVYHRLAQIAIGRQLHAEVLSLLDDGTFLVRVADANARMALPVGTRVGDSLPMMMVAREPRPTFLLGTQEGSATASLSAAGRLIDSILQAAQQEGKLAVVGGASPLLDLPTADPKQIAASLRNTVAFSGLFYESHLHQWTSGERTLAELMREPQAQHGRPGAGATAEELGRLGENLRQLGDASRTLTDLIRDAQSSLANGPPVDAYAIPQPDAAAGRVDPELARLINLQLDALEHQRLRWHGELWPGQPMEWEVSEDAPDSHAEYAAQPGWKSTVRFELPTLGEIAATIHLVDGRVHVQVQTASEAAAASLLAHGGELADALEAAGAPLNSLTVKKNEPA